MNKKSVLITHRPLRNVVLATFALVTLGACTQQKAQQQLQTELNAAKACLAKQEMQAQQVSGQQVEILRQLQAVQQQLAVQQQTIEAKPQVVERVVEQKCPPVAASTKKSPAKEQPMTDKQIVGLREQALIAGLNMVMQARISTNVANSVIDARNIQMFERNGEEWVRFTLYNPDTKEPHVLERKRLRFQTVQTASATPDRRPVVEIRFTIGKLSQKGEFILADRSSSEYPILIGRNLLRDVMLVDVSGNNLAPLQRPDENAPAKN
ncbi:RimK/LysX family protein [Cellvibrio sp. pealriver]|uniref:ATP-dependent zinc protease family protein n=1 Tax=Cellvibrio sp. pealriver TaxID=1622269 RepID=UPI00066FBADE|nr:RimK/LysX family protein [Cellvibrio sp. pealriver]